MYGSLHLTSVWLCMSVVFVVTVQWPIDTKVTSPFILFLNTYPFSMSLKTIYFASNQILKILCERD